MNDVSSPTRMPVQVGEPYQFTVGDITVSPTDHELRTPAGSVRLEPRLMTLLCFLCGHPGQLLTREQILRAVWGDVSVSDDALHYAISQLRKHLGDNSRQPRYIETIPKRGYRWVATTTPPVETPSVTTPPRRLRSPLIVVSAMAALALLSLFVFQIIQHSATPLPRAIAVLPTQSDDRALDAEQADVTDELVSALVSLPELRVSGQLSVMHAQRRAQEPSDIGQQLEVHALLQPHLRRMGEHWQLYVELLDERGQHVLWTNKAQATGTGPELVRPTVEALAHFLQLPLSASAYDAQSPGGKDYLLGRRLLQRRSPGALREAEQAFRRGLLVAPDSGRLWAGLADALTLTSYYDWSRESAPLLEDALAAARKAVQLNPDNPDCQAALGHVLMTRGQNDEARVAFKAALQRSPYHGPTLHWLGEVEMYDGAYASAKALFERALAVDPLAPVVHETAGMNAALQGDVARAHQHFLDAIQLEPDMPGPHRSLAGLALQTGDWKSALEHFQLAVNYGYTRPAGYLEIAGLQLRLGNREEALRWFAAVQQSNRSPPYHLQDWYIALAFLSDDFDAFATTHSQLPLLSALRDFVRGQPQTLLTLAQQNSDNALWLSPRSIRIAQYLPAVYLYAALLQQKDDSAAQWRQKIEAVLNDREQSTSAFYGSELVRAQLAVLDGDIERALASIQRAGENGFQDVAQLQRDPILKALWPTLTSKSWFTTDQHNAMVLVARLKPKAEGWLPPAS